MCITVSLSSFHHLKFTALMISSYLSSFFPPNSIDDCSAEVIEDAESAAALVSGESASFVLVIDGTDANSLHFASVVHFFYIHSPFFATTVFSALHTWEHRQCHVTSC
jgi:hypothetical protein